MKKGEYANLGIVRGDKLPEWELPLFQSLNKFGFNPVLIASNHPNELNSIEYRRALNIRGNGTLNRILLTSIIGKAFKFGLDLNLMEYGSRFLFSKNVFQNLDLVQLVDEAYFPALQAIQKVNRSVMTVWENIPFNYTIENTVPTAKLKKKVFDRVNFFLPVSDEAKFSLISQGIDENRIVKIHPGIDLKKIKSRNSNKEIFQREGLKKDSTILLGVGRLEYFKGITYVMRALKKLKLQDKNVMYFHIGSGNGKFANYVTELSYNLGINDVFKMIGNVEYSKVFEYYANAHLFLLPSVPTLYWEEQMGFSILESMASGSIPIVSDIPTLEEVVPNNSGIRIPVGNANRLTEEIMNFIKSPDSYSEMRRKGIEHVVKNYNSTISAELHSQLYKKVISEF